MRGQTDIIDPSEIDLNNVIADIEENGVRTERRLPVGIEAPLVIGGTFAGCALLHELVIRRVGFLRPLFGLKPASASPVSRKASAAATV